MAFGYVISTVIGSFLGWRYAFLLWGIFGIILSITNSVFVLEPNIVEKSEKDNFVQKNMGIKEDLKKEINLSVFF